MISSMPQALSLVLAVYEGGRRRPRFRDTKPWFRLQLGFRRGLRARYPCHLLERARHPPQRSREVWNVDEGEEQADHPEDVLVGEERQQAQHGDDLELQLL